MGRRASSGRAALTLIELLVAIAVVGLFASLLMSAVQGRLAALGTTRR